jgi:hypothetical protein
MSLLCLPHPLLLLLLLLLMLLLLLLLSFTVLNHVPLHLLPPIVQWR